MKTVQTAYTTANQMETAGNRLTAGERKWVLYDVGNSAFTLLISTILPIYFNFLCNDAGLTDAQYLAYWGYAASVSTIIVIFLAPTIGTITDTKGFRRPIFMTSVLAGAVACIMLGFAKQWLLFLVIFIISKIFYQISLVIYDSMLGDVTTADRLDDVSSRGYAFGYIGSCIPAVICFAVYSLYESIGITFRTAMFLCFVIIAVWWIIMTVPLFHSYRQNNYVERKPHAVRESFRRLGKTFLEIRKEKKAFLFLVAFFFYIDGVYTIIDMATAYGTALGLDTIGLLVALFVTQLVAFPSAIVIGRLSRRVSVTRLITVCIVSYLGIAVFAVFLTQQWQFWILAVWVGLFQGGIQALSRSYFTRIIPAEKSGEFFGLYDICGKGAACLGTAIVSLMTQITGRMNLGVGMIAVLFVIGIIIFRAAVKTEGRGTATF